MDNKLLGQESNTFANIFTFMGLPLSRNLGSDLDAVVMGIPYDMATSARSGTRYGPNGIRQASSQLRWEQVRWPWTFALEQHYQTIDYGDIEFDVGNSQSMIDEVMAHASKVIAANKFLLSFGGDHFVSLPLLRAVAKTHGKVALVHFDAHTDTEKSHLEFYHGSMFDVAFQEGILDAKHSVQVGIRTEHDATSNPFEIIDAAWVNNHTAAETIERINTISGQMPVYLTIDIDCLDPAYAPGTGTPVVGGLTSDRLLQIIRGLSELNIVAADITEVAPPYDHSEITALAGASIALDILYLQASRVGAK